MVISKIVEFGAREKLNISKKSSKVMFSTKLSEASEARNQGPRRVKGFGKKSKFGLCFEKRVCRVIYKSPEKII